jgi:hypothetical protein
MRIEEIQAIGPSVNSLRVRNTIAYLLITECREKQREGVIAANILQHHAVPLHESDMHSCIRSVLFGWIESDCGGWKRGQSLQACREEAAHLKPCDMTDNCGNDEKMLSRHICI